MKNISNVFAGHSGSKAAGCSIIKLSGSRGAGSRITRIIKNMVCLGMVMVFILCQTGCGAGSKTSGSSVTPGSSITPAPKGDIKDIANDKGNVTLTGILSGKDDSGKKLHFIDISSGTEYSVPYTGGTDIQDAHGKVKAVTVMDIGEIYDVYCNSKGTAVKIYGNSNAWERNEVTNATIDENSRKITIGGTNLVYEKYALVTSKDKLLSIAQIVKQDELTIRGIGDKAYSIVVDKGHGYLTLTGVDAFSGGYVSLGSKQLYGITDNMVITAKEGTYSVEVQNGSMVASKTVTVIKDQSTTLDFSEYKTESEKKGAINFSVTPTNAVMTIDGVEVDYSNPVSLTYGTHYLTLSANYYTSYTETFVVNSAYKTKVIDMTSTSATKSSSTTSATTADKTRGYSVKVTAPEGASLYVDSVYVGVIPCSFNKSSGNKTITLTQSGYNTISYTINIANATGDLTYAFPSMESSSSSSTTPTVETPTVATPTAATISGNN
ncbi:MAG: PEGA domain-containing protein [Eubacteriales bacterium]|nr:PEGA domain-containing protein [Eubacteriales bacterium]